MKLNPFRQAPEKLSDSPPQKTFASDVNKVVYVIFLTALAITENLVEALKAGADDYLTKPFKSAELIARIHVGLRVVNLQMRWAITSRSSKRL